MEVGKNLPHWPMDGQVGGICTGQEACIHEERAGICKMEGVADVGRADGGGVPRSGGSGGGGGSSRGAGCCSEPCGIGPRKPRVDGVALVREGEVGARRRSGNGTGPWRRRGAWKRVGEKDL